MSKNNGKLNAVTFLYGFGAAVVLVGAMFKFMGWQFANELFIAGLSVEVVVFLVSAFERQSDDKEYKWENVFPQLSSDENGQADTQQYQEAMKQFASTLTELTQQLSGVTGSISLMKSELENSAKNSLEMKNKMAEFNELMGDYNKNLKTINDKYSELLKK
jgi:predicted RNase H-like nuclease (RuvC/YqgF family)